VDLIDKSGRLIRQKQDGIPNSPSCSVHIPHAPSLPSRPTSSLKMHTYSLSLIISLFVSSTFQSLITFSNPTSTTSPTRQRCSDGGYIDICCIPLDLDLNDGNGYGSFQPQQASFQDLGYIDVFAAIYRNSPTLSPCYGEATITKTCFVNWKSPTFKQRPYISGVLVQRSSTPMFARKRMPNSVIVEGREYLWDGVVGGPRLFKDAGGKTIRGKPFGVEVRSNLTYAAIR